jgi:two-component system nitrogen regulation response regulator GlnG
VAAEAIPASVADRHPSSADFAAAYPVSGSSAPPAQSIGSTVASGSWEADLEAEALALLVSGQTDVWDVLTRRFESKLIQTALVNTRGRRIEAAQKLGIGRNTITRKIQELGLE